MSPPLLGILEEGQSNVSLPVSSIALDNICPKNSELKVRNYMGLSDCSSVDSSAILGNSERNKYGLNLKGTELRLGLPGSRSPERDVELCLQSPGKLDEKPLFSFLSSKEEVLSKEDIFSPLSRNITLGNKRGFSEKGASGNTGNPLAAKAQVIGWPPVKSYRKNTLSTTSKNNDEKHNQEVDGKPGPGALYVKVSMDGAPYLRKVDLRAYSSYHNLSSALEKMFSCFTLGQCGPHGAPGMESLSESKLRDLLHGSEYALAYEDKDLDWMLVGDVPWEFRGRIHFICSLRIVKCPFFSGSVYFLGYMIDDQGICLDLKKVKAIVEWLVPTSSVQVQQFYGLATSTFPLLKDLSLLLPPLQIHGR